MDFIVLWIAGSFGFMAPLLLAALGLILTERVGILNLGAEGVLAFSAMAGAVMAYGGASPVAALTMASVAGAVIMVPFAAAVIVFRAPQIPAGLALVAIGLGASAAIGRDAAHKPFAGLQDMTLLGLADLPVVGPLLFGHDALVYLALICAAVMAWVFRKTRLGLRLRAIGEDPATADSVGVSVQMHQVGAALVSGLLLGLAGGYLTIVGAQVWTEGMVAGRGWIALALVVFAQWSPVRAIFGAFVFGAADALIPRLQAIGADIPVYFLSMFPYALTIAVLCVVVIQRREQSNEPGFLGRVYVRQDR